MTGPHRFDGVSHPPKQDSTRKVAPVDTVRLKKDLQDDVDTIKHGLKVQAREMENGEGANGIGKGLIDFYAPIAKARSDSLNQARSGKIPAKKAGKP